MVPLTYRELLLHIKWLFCKDSCALQYGLCIEFPHRWYLMVSSGRRCLRYQECEEVCPYGNACRMKEDEVVSFAFFCQQFYFLQKRNKAEPRGKRKYGENTFCWKESIFSPGKGDLVIMVMYKPLQCE